MKIDDVRVVVHRRAMPATDGPVPPGPTPLGVLRIRTDEGVEGDAFVSGPGPASDVLCDQIVRLLKPVLIGRDPLDVGAIWGDLWKRRQLPTSSPSARSTSRCRTCSARWPVCRCTGCSARVARRCRPTSRRGCTAGPRTTPPKRPTTGPRGGRATRSIRRRSCAASARCPLLKGGITPLMKIAHLAAAFHMNCEVHDGFNALGNLACVHVVMAIANREMYEVLTINPIGTYGLQHLSYGLTEPIAFDADWHVLAPTRPGLGRDIDWDLINSSVVAELV